MKAIIISSYGGPDVLTVTELPDPVPAAGEVLIAVRASGLNHAEASMHSGAKNSLCQAKPARVFGFDDIVEAHKVTESGLAGGKMTVSVT